MKQRVILSLLTGLLMTGCNSAGSSGSAQQATAKPAAMSAEVTFDWFKYATPNNRPAAPAGEYANPILPGFYPDPSITKKR